MNKQPVVIVCGPDRCGKSNIVDALSMRLGLPTFKPSNEHAIFLGDQKGFLDALRYSDFRTVDFLKKTGYGVIFDRQYPCEWVYSRFFKRETDNVALEKLDEEFASIGTKILVCTRKSFDGIVDDLNPKLAGDRLQEISSLYKLFAEFTRCEITTIYVDDEDLDREVNEIVTFLGA